MMAGCWVSGCVSQLGVHVFGTVEPAGQLAPLAPQQIRSTSVAKLSSSSHAQVCMPEEKYLTSRAAEGSGG